MAHKSRLQITQLWKVKAAETCNSWSHDTHNPCMAPGICLGLGGEQMMEKTNIWTHGQTDRHRQTGWGRLSPLMEKPQHLGSSVYLLHTSEQGDRGFAYR